jgi:hypothetical protein
MFYWFISSFRAFRSFFHEKKREIVWGYRRKTEFREELTDCIKVKERFTGLPGQREESVMRMRQAPALGSGTSSTRPGTSSSPTGTSTSSTASGRTRTPLKGGRRIKLKYPLINCYANDTLCADSSSCRVTAVLRSEDDRSSQAEICATNEGGQTLILEHHGTKRNIAEATTAQLHRKFSITHPEEVEQT